MPIPFDQWLESRQQQPPIEGEEDISPLDNEKVPFDEWVKKKQQVEGPVRLRDVPTVVGKVSSAVFPFLDKFNQVLTYPWYGATIGAIEGTGVKKGFLEGLRAEKRPGLPELLEAAELHPVVNYGKRMQEELGVEKLPPAAEKRLRHLKGIFNFGLTFVEPDLLSVLGPARMAMKLPTALSKLSKAERVGEGLQGAAETLIKAWRKKGIENIPIPDSVKERIREKALGTPFAKHFAHTLDYGEQGEKADKLMNLAKYEQRKFNERAADLSQQMENAKIKLLEEVPEGTIDENVLRKWEDRVWDAIERADWRGVDELGLNAQDVQDLLLYNDRLLDESRGIQKRLGMPRDTKIKQEGYRWVPHIREGKEEFKDLSWRKITKRPPSRGILKFLDKEGREFWRGDPSWKGSPVSVLQDDKSGLKWYVKKGDGKEPEFLRAEQLTRTEKEALLKTPNAFMTDLGKVLAINTRQKIGKLYTLKMVEGLTNDGVLRRLKPKEVPPAGWRTVNLKGMEEFVAPKHIANLVEHVGRAYLDPKSFAGLVDAIIRGTKPGQVVKRIGQSVARNFLALFPSFYTRNFDANLVLIWLAGVRNPKRASDAWKILRGKGKVAGFPAEMLKKEFEKRGLIGTGFAETFTSDLQPFRITDAIADTGPAQALARVPGVKPVFSTLKKGMMKGEKAIDWAFKKGEAIEDHGKLMIAIDYYFKQRKKYPNKPAEKILDEAAVWAKKNLFDYSDLTRTEEGIKVLYPFYGWVRNIMARTLRAAIHQPSELGQIERFHQRLPGLLGGQTLDEFQPGLSEAAPKYAQEGGTILFPSSPEDPYPSAFLSANFSPFMTPQQAWNNPTGFFLEQLNPVWRMIPEILANRRAYGGVPIDRGNVEGPVDMFLGKGDRTKFLGISMPPVYAHMLQSLPTGRYLQTADVFLRNFFPSWAADPFRAPLSRLETLIWGFTGGKQTRFDIEKWKRRYRWQKLQGPGAYRREIRALQQIIGSPHTTPEQKAAAREMLQNALQRFQKYLREQEKTRAGAGP